VDVADPIRTRLRGCPHRRASVYVDVSSILKLATVRVL
jgi:hypothetical protein